jgi:hypothetical protein
MRYLRFDLKRTRSERLQSDKFLFFFKFLFNFIKPDKFGIKFWMLVYNDTKYLSNAFPYLGKDELRSADESLPESVVMQLMSPYLNKGRNVTTDSFFTSASLAQTLKAKDMSIVGTISRTRREIPAVLTMERAPFMKPLCYEMVMVLP